MDELTLILCHGDDFDDEPVEFIAKRDVRFFVGLNSDRNVSLSEDSGPDSCGVITDQDGSWKFVPDDATCVFINRQLVGSPTVLHNGDIITWMESPSFVTCYSANELVPSREENPGGTSACLRALKESGGWTAELALFERYYPRLVDVARATLHSARLRSFDEEDVASEALREFYAGLSDGRFSHLQRHRDLWALLVCMTRRRAIDMLRRVTAKHRSPKLIRGESVFLFNSLLDLPSSQQVGRESKLPETVQVDSEEEVHNFLEFLAACDPNIPLHKITEYRIAGMTNGEIASRLDMSLRSVERAVTRIRNLWDQHATRNRDRPPQSRDDV